jgi:hypothetical protein
MAVLPDLSSLWGGSNAGASTGIARGGGAFGNETRGKATVVLFCEKT